MRPAEQFWKQTRGAAWVANYAASSFGAHRALMGAALRGVAPFQTVLDIGCNCGVLMPWLMTASPDVQVTGIDLSHEALLDADRQWPQQKWVHDSVVDWLPKQPTDEKFDVIVSSSCLAHIAPNDIQPTLEAITQRARKAIVLQEVAALYGAQEAPSTSVGVMEWKYDYHARMDRLGWHTPMTTPFGTDPSRPGYVMIFTRKME